MKTFQSIRLLIPGAFTLWMVLVLSAGQARSASMIDAALSNGFELQELVKGQVVHSFTWDERGDLWTLNGNGDRLSVNLYSFGKSCEAILSHSFERRGNRSAGLLVHADRVFVSDGNAIRIFRRTANKEFSEET